MSMEQRLTGSHTAKRYALWRSRQAVLNALIGDAGDSVYRPDDATADAIASLGEVLVSCWHTSASCTGHEYANRLAEQRALGPPSMLNHAQVCHGAHSEKVLLL